MLSLRGDDNAPPAANEPGAALRRRRGIIRSMSAKPRSTRREFLQGQAAIDAVAHFDAGAAAAVSLPEPSADRYLVRLSRQAMACTFEVFLNAGEHDGGTAAALAALDLVDRLEDQLSVYRDESEICHLNRHAPFGPVPVEARLFDLLRKAVELHRDTHGAFDVTAGRLSSVWGFKTRRGQLPPPEEIEAALECVGTQYLELDAGDNSVRFARPGVEVNLGSIGKGYALDRCAELLADAGIDSYLLHGGNSSVLARGTQGGAVEDGWQVGLRHPLRPERRLGQLRLADRALATSGSGTQFFRHEGRRLGHILDPRRGWPAEGVLTASAVAPTAAEADALATAFYVMGPAATRDYCQQHPLVGAMMICPGRGRGPLKSIASGSTTRIGPYSTRRNCLKRRPN